MEATRKALDLGSAQTSPCYHDHCCGERAGVRVCSSLGAAVLAYFLQHFPCVLTTLATVKCHHCWEAERKVTSSWQ